MIKITDEKDNIRVEGEEISRHYPYEGILTIPKNSVLLILDEDSDMVVFKSASNYDTWFTGIIGSIQIEGELVTRDNIVDKFNAVAYSAYSSSGGEGGGVTSINGQTGDISLKTINGYSLLGEGNIYVEGGGEGMSCCNDLMANQTKILSMLESLTNDKNIINDMIDKINNEMVECEYPESNVINDIIGDEITC